MLLLLALHREEASGEGVHNLAYDLISSGYCNYTGSYLLIKL